MPHLYLPVDHTDADLILAGQIAEAVQSAELYVTWTASAGQAAPELGTLMREVTSPWAEALGLLARVVGELWAALTRRPAEPAPAQAPTAAPGASRPHPAAGETAA